MSPSSPRPTSDSAKFPVAAIVGDVDDEVLDTTVRANLAPYKAPTVYHHVTALPRSEVGKVLRRRLAEELA